MSVQFYGYEFGDVGVFHCSVIMHCFKKLNSDLGTFLHLKLCVNKIAIEFALVYEHKELEFLIWDIFCWACSQWRELASIW